MTPLIIALLGLGPAEIAIIILVLVLLFGASKVPDLARSIGRAKGEFERARRSVEKEVAQGEREGSGTAKLPEDEEERKETALRGVSR